MSASFALKTFFSVFTYACPNHCQTFEKKFKKSLKSSQKSPLFHFISNHHIFYSYQSQNG